MIYRIYAGKDTYITNDVRLSVRQTGSNVGQSEEISVFKRTGISGTIGTLGSSSLGRILLQFDFSAYSSLTASGDIPTAGSSFRLKLAHKTSNETLPYSFDLVVAPVSRSWDEGRGMDIGGLADAGTSNWIQPERSTYWEIPGGDVLPTPTATIHFDTGYEDLDVDVSSIVRSWLTGGIPNNGFCISMSPDIEADSNYGNYYIKKFYSRHSSYPDRVPYLEMEVPDYRFDDRDHMVWGKSGSLYLYNVVDGQYVDLDPGPVVVSISDSSGTILSTTAGYVSTGVYSASFALRTGSYSGSIFYDSWRLGSLALMTGSFSLASGSPVSTRTQNLITARVRNLAVEYSPDEVVRFDVVFRRKPNVLPVVSTASLGVPPYIVSKGYYAIENDSTRELVVPFGTGSESTRLSYDGNGNYFKFFMSSLRSGNVYRILFLVEELGSHQMIDPGIRFKVT